MAKKISLQKADVGPGWTRKKVSVSRDPMQMAPLAAKMVGRFPGHWEIAE